MKIPKLARWDCVLIVWTDSQGLPGEWQKITNRDTRIAGCVTVGQVYQVHKDRLTIICSWDSLNKHGHGGITIPFVNITALRKLS